MQIMPSNQHPLVAVLLLLTCFLICLEVCVQNTSSSATTEAEAEAKALLKWKRSLYHSSSLASWRDSDGVCTWKGIVCSTSGSISEIDASFSGLNGTLTQFNFSAFPKPRYLNISNNLLSGSVPFEIGQLTKLEYLDLYNNLNLEGVLPYQISHLQSLRYLDLGGNYLASPRRTKNNYLVTVDWSKFVPMPLLNYLSLALNSLSSEFPPFILASNNLLHLDLSINYFHGTIPEAVYTNLSRLEVLKLYSNQFGGSISSSIGLLINLHVLDLDTNKFNSSIPPELGECTNLTFLSIAQNSLTGELPTSLINIKKISQLDFSYNALLGET